MPNAKVYFFTRRSGVGAGRDLREAYRLGSQVLIMQSNLPDYGDYAEDLYPILVKISPNIVMRLLITFIRRVEMYWIECYPTDNWIAPIIADVESGRLKDPHVAYDVACQKHDGASELYDRTEGMKSLNEASHRGVQIFQAQNAASAVLHLLLFLIGEDEPYFAAACAIEDCWRSSMFADEEKMFQTKEVLEA